MKGLQGKCFSTKSKDGHYEYRVCPFDNVTQHDVQASWNACVAAPDTPVTPPEPPFAPFHAATGQRFERPCVNNTVSRRARATRQYTWLYRAAAMFPARRSAAAQKKSSLGSLRTGGLAPMQVQRRPRDLAFVGP